jgi:hypothetical protein
MYARPAIQAWVEELKADRAGILGAHNLAIEQATRHIALTKEAVSAELVKIGFAIVDIKEAKISDKRQALMDTAKLFGRIIERREQKNVDEFAAMSAEEIEAWLAERAKLVGETTATRPRRAAAARRAMRLGDARGARDVGGDQ